MAAEKREQVFVSSTYIDLVEERQEVIQTLLEADCIPAGMELFPASDDDRWTLIQRVIDDCDYYVVVVGGRYGSVDPERNLSYTEMEFDYAVSRKKPVMGFLHGRPGSIAAEKVEMDSEAQERLEAFRRKVGERMVKYWSNPSELGGAVAKSLIQIRKTHPAEGWIRASNALTPEVERELAELRARVAELTGELAEQRRNVPAVEIEALAQGEDEYAMNVSLVYLDKKSAASGSRYPRTEWDGIFEVTWNDLFASIGPLMMDEATEGALDEQLDGLARVVVLDSTDRLPDDAHSIGRVQVAADVINDVKVQFFSLGLIERSERRRAVSDSNTYWTLTAAGRDQLMRLRAIRRDGVRHDVGTVVETAEVQVTDLT